MNDFEDAPYDILGIPHDAQAGQIRMAYRCLVKKYHPDRNPGNREAEEKFRQVQRAYEKLTSRDKENTSLSHDLKPKQSETFFSGVDDPFFSFFEGLKAYCEKINIILNLNKKERKLHGESE